MNSPLRYAIYARKSTNDKSRQALSIPAQIRELREFAVQNQLNILRVFQEKQTARKPGRPVFNEMLQLVESGQFDAILAWHPNRLSRNSLDGGRVIQLLDEEVLKDLKFPTHWFETTTQG